MISSEHRALVKILDDATKEMDSRGAILARAITDHVIQSNRVAQLRLALDALDAAAWLDPNVIGPYTNRDQREAAVALSLQANDTFLAKRKEHDDAVAERGRLEGEVEHCRALLSVEKRRAEMAVALARGLATE